MKTFFKQHLLLIIVCGIVILNLAFCTYIRNEVWNDPLHRTKKNAESMPNKARVINNYGCELNDNGKYEEALVQFKKALELEPKNPDSWYNLGTAYMYLKRYDESYDALIKSLTLNNPTFAGDYNDASLILASKAHNNLGLVLAMKGRYKEAAAEFNQALIRDPNLKGVKENFNLAMQHLK